MPCSALRHTRRGTPNSVLPNRLQEGERPRSTRPAAAAEAAAPRPASSSASITTACKQRQAAPPALTLRSRSAFVHALWAAAQQRAGHAMHWRPGHPTQISRPIPWPLFVSPGPACVCVLLLASSNSLLSGSASVNELGVVRKQHLGRRCRCEQRGQCWGPGDMSGGWGWAERLGLSAVSARKHRRPLMAGLHASEVLTVALN
jgi:hypothetical protein